MCSHQTVNRNGNMIPSFLAASFVKNSAITSIYQDGGAAAVCADIFPPKMIMSFPTTKSQITSN